MVTLLTCLSAATDSPSVIIPSGPAPITVSHLQLVRQVLAFQRKLAKIGIAHHSAVASAFPNSLEFIVAFLATGLQRSVAAPLNPAYKQEEFEFYLEDLKAEILLLPKGTIAEDGEAVRAARKFNVAIAEVYWDGDAIALEMGEAGCLEGRGAAAVEEPQQDDVALILHTSGTTGRPKAVPLTHKNLARTMVNIQTTYGLTAFDRTLLVMPLFHVHGLLCGLLTPLMTGGSVIVPQRFSASEFWKDFIDHEANWYTAVPTIHQILLKSALPSPMPSMRFVRSCSSPLAPAVYKQLESVMNAPVLEAYAMTEAAHQMTSNPLPPASRKAGSVGKPQGIELQIMNDEGKELDQGEIGEVCVRGENVTSGYLGDPSVFASPFTDNGYLRTGDQGYLDREGYLYLTGRIKELINKGGEKISPIELDNIWAQHRSISEAVSFAIDDELYGQNIGLAVTFKEGCLLTAEELEHWFSQRAAKFKTPKKIYFTAHMPKTATGKIQRRQVAKAMLEHELEKAASMSSASSASSMHFLTAAEVAAAANAALGPPPDELLNTRKRSVAFVDDDKLNQVRELMEPNEVIFTGDYDWLKRPELTRTWSSLWDGIKALAVWVTTGELI